MEFLSFFFALGLGFGIAFWIAASLLNESNNFGDSHADPSSYMSEIEMVNDSGAFDKYPQSSSLPRLGQKRSPVPLAPKGKELIEKSKGFPIKKELPVTKEQSPTGTVPQKTTPNPDATGSSFPRSFR
ncbi:MAG: hypothetical protein J5750_01260 [Clostridiales bacterium]|nr:hypothetical protein [Clostridiales bacterium]